jgi:hypothetical protein
MGLLTFASVGIVLGALLLTGEFPVSDILNVLGAFAGIGVAALTAVAIYMVDRGWRRRLLLITAGLLLPTAASPLTLAAGLMYIILGWTVYFTLAIYNPSLRMSEVSQSELRELAEGEDCKAESVWPIEVQPSRAERRREARK